MPPTSTKLFTIFEGTVFATLAAACGVLVLFYGFQDYVTLVPEYSVRVFSLGGISLFGLVCVLRGFGWRAIPMSLFAGAFAEMQFNLLYEIPCPNSFGYSLMSTPAWPLYFSLWFLLIPLSLLIARPSVSRYALPAWVGWGAWSAFFYGVMGAPIVREFCTSRVLTIIPSNWPWEFAGFIALFLLWVFAWSPKR